MLSASQERLLERFVEGLRFDGYDDYHVRPIQPGNDSGLHAQGWQGRFLMLSSTVRLEIFGQTFDFAEGESYEVLPDVTHREVFGNENPILVIARKDSGKPLPPVKPEFTLQRLR